MMEKTTNREQGQTSAYAVRRCLSSVLTFVLAFTMIPVGDLEYAYAGEALPHVGEERETGQLPEDSVAEEQLQTDSDAAGYEPTEFAEGSDRESIVAPLAEVAPGSSVQEGAAATTSPAKGASSLSEAYATIDPGVPTATHVFSDGAVVTYPTEVVVGDPFVVEGTGFFAVSTHPDYDPDYDPDYPGSTVAFKLFDGDAGVLKRQEGAENPGPNAGDEPVIGNLEVWGAVQADENGNFGLVLEWPTDENTTGDWPIAVGDKITLQLLTGSLYGVSGVDATRTVGLPMTAVAATPTYTEPTFTVHPQDVTVEVGQTAEVTVRIEGPEGSTVNRVQLARWNETAGTWTNLALLMSGTYELPFEHTFTTYAAQAAWDGVRIAARYGSPADAVYSNEATLTVNSAAVAPTVSQSPQSVTVTEGDSASFSVAATGHPTPTVQWQSSIDGAIWVNIAGATDTTLAVTDTTLMDSGTQYRAVFTNAIGSATTDAATLTVNPLPAVAPVVTAHPSNVTRYAGLNATFTADASGRPAPTVQWESSLDGENWSSVPEATGTTLTLSSLSLDQNGSRYRAVFTNEAGSATTDEAVLTVVDSGDIPVGGAPYVTVQPQDAEQTSSENAVVTLRAEVAGSTPPTSVQWEFKLPGTDEWTTQWGSSEMPWSGARTLIETEGSDYASTLSLGYSILRSRDSLANGTQYRAVFVNEEGSTTTAAATLTRLEPQLMVTTEGPYEVGDTIRGYLIGPDGEYSTRIDHPDGTTNPLGYSYTSGVYFTTINVSSAQFGTLIEWEYVVPPFRLNIQQGYNPAKPYLAIFPFAAGDARIYFVDTDGAESTGETVELVATEGDIAPVITAQPVDVVAAIGSDGIRSAGFEANGNYFIGWQSSSRGEYQPRFQTATVIDGTTATFSQTVYDASSWNSNIRLIVANSAGVAVSKGASLVEPFATSVITDLASTYGVLAGEPTVLIAVGRGGPRPNVTWYSSMDGVIWMPVAEGVVSVDDGVWDISSTLTIPNTSGLLDGTRFKAVFTNNVGEAETRVLTLAVTADTAAPSVTEHPESVTVVAGSDAVFAVVATGTPTPTVQWQSKAADGDWADIGGATDTALTVAGATEEQSGTLYRAVFTNSAGSAASEAATLTVRAPSPDVWVTATSDSYGPAGFPVQTATYEYPEAVVYGQPITIRGTGGFIDTTGTKGSVINFLVDAAYSGDPNTLNRVNSQLQLKNPIDGRNYTDTRSFGILQAGGADGKGLTNTHPDSWASAVLAEQDWEAGTWELTVPWPEAEFLALTEEQLAGRTAEQWLEENWAVGTEHFVRGLAGSSLSGDYQRGFNSSFTIVAGPASQVAPEVTVQPQNASVAFGEDAVFSAEASGTPAPAVQWESSADGEAWAAVEGATSETLTVEGWSSLLTGTQYRAVFTNAAGSVVTDPASLTVGLPSEPTFTVHPQDVTVEVGQTAEVTVRIEGPEGSTVNRVQLARWNETAGTWTNLALLMSGTYELPFEHTFTTYAAQAAWDGVRIAARYGSPADAVYSNEATLTVVAPSQVEVVPEAPVQDGNTVTIPSVEGVVYVDQADGSPLEPGAHELTADLTVAAQAAEGYAFPADAVTEWTFAYTAPAEATATHTFSDGAVVTYPTQVVVGESFVVEGTGFFAVSTHPDYDPDYPGSTVAFKLFDENEGVLKRQEGVENPGPNADNEPVIVNLEVWGAVQADENGNFTLELEWPTDENAQVSYDWQPGTEFSIQLLSGTLYNGVVGAVPKPDVSRSAALWTTVVEAPVVEAPVVITQPASTLLAPDAAGTEISAAADGSDSVRWQVSADGTDWADVSGAAAATLTLSRSDVSDGSLYRAVFTNAAGEVASDPAKLYVVPEGYEKIEHGDAVWYAPTTVEEGGAAVLYGDNWLAADGVTGSGIALRFDDTGTSVANYAEAGTGLFRFACEFPDTWTAGSAPHWFRLMSGALVPGDTLRVTRSSDVTITGGQEVPPAPSVDGSDLDESNANGMTAVVEGSSVVVDLAGAASDGDRLYGYLYSEPQALGWTDAADGKAVFTLPEGVEGEHTVAVVSAAGTLLGHARIFIGSESDPAAPAVTAQPQDALNAVKGSTVTFTAAASGYPEPAVQWYRSTNLTTGAPSGWTAIAGATENTLTVVAGTSPHVNNRQYKAVFTNASGEAETAFVRLTVVPVPTVKTHPSGVTVSEGETARFSAKAVEGVLPITVQWQRAGVSLQDGEPDPDSWVDIPGATGEELVIEAASIGADIHNTYYRAVFANASGTTATNAAQLRLVDRLDTEGTETVSGTAYGPGDYDASYTVSAANAFVPGEPIVISGTGYTHPDGEQGSVANFFIDAAYSGDPNTLNTTREITNPVTGAVVSDKRTHAMVQADKAGNWQVEIPWPDHTNTQKDEAFFAENWAPGTHHIVRVLTGSSLAGDGQRGITVRFTVAYEEAQNSAPTVLTHPQSATVEVGTTHTLTALAYGMPAPDVQWQVSYVGTTDWVDIPGLVNPSAPIKNLQLSDSGNRYRAKFTNSEGVVYSDIAVLTVVKGGSEPDPEDVKKITNPDGTVWYCPTKVPEGGTFEIWGEGWLQKDGTTGSLIAVKLDSGNAIPNHEVINPATGEPTDDSGQTWASRGVWVIIEADENTGNWRQEIRVPAAGTALSSAWIAGEKHYVFLLSRTLAGQDENGEDLDISRSTFSEVTVTTATGEVVDPPVIDPGNDPSGNNNPNTSDGSGTQGTTKAGGSGGGGGTRVQTSVVNDKAPTTTPQAPVDSFDDLNESNKGAIELTEAEGAYVLTFSGRLPGDWLYLYIYSADGKHKAGGWHQLDKDKVLRFGAEALSGGTFKLAFVDENSNMIGWVEVGKGTEENGTGQAALKNDKGNQAAQSNEDAAIGGASSGGVDANLILGGVGLAVLLAGGAVLLFRRLKR